MEQQAAIPTSIFQLNFQTIKYPQLIGIIAGCIVFIVTISVVFYLLYASGTLTRAFQEIQEGSTSANGKGKGRKRNGKIDVDENGDSISPYSSQPELFEHLLEARFSLPDIFCIPEINGPNIQIRMLKTEDCNDLFSALNGTPQYDESQYNPIRLWGWHEFPYLDPKQSSSEQAKPWMSLEQFNLFITLEQKRGKSFIVIIDKDYSKPVGFISTTDNKPMNLTITIDSILLTPAFQGKRRGHEALLFLLEWLFQNGYRRVSSECDERHIIYRKFLQRCFFQMEAVLKKHRIVAGRNCNTAIYSMVNSDWPQIEIHFKSLLKIPLKKDVKAIDIIGFSSNPDNDHLSKQSSISRDDSSIVSESKAKLSKKKKSKNKQRN